MRDGPLERRTVLGLAGGLLAAGLAGCSGDDAPSGEAVSPTATAGDADDAGNTATPDTTPTGAETDGDGTPDGYSHTFVLSEFRADPEAGRADPDSERTVMEIPQPQANHNAGAITFGPDGYLYVATGDSGRAND